MSSYMNGYDNESLVTEGIDSSGSYYRLGKGGNKYHFNEYSRISKNIAYLKAFMEWFLFVPVSDIKDKEYKLIE